MELVSILSSYLPIPLARQLLDNPSRSLLNEGARFDGVTLFIDMAGFTPLAEALGQVGPAGTEELTDILNQLFSQLIVEIHRWGGIVGKFAGDAMTVHFSGPQAPYRALTCALALQQHIARVSVLETLAGPFTLRMKQGLAAGSILQAIIGTPEHSEFVYAGHPPSDAARAEGRARPGEIILHPSLIPLLDPTQLKQKILENGFVRMEGLNARAAPAPHPNLVFPSEPAPAIQALRPFVPPQLYKRLRAGQGAFINEHRRITVLFVGFEGIDYQRSDAVDLLGNYIRAVFEIVKRFDGYACRVDMADKGSRVMILFGAPDAHENDEERALLCALALQARAREIKGITAQRIGINSGRAFAGEVGSPKRHEYTAMGDTVNLAARLMQAVEPGQILVGEESRRLVKDLFTWEALPPLKVKGKAAAVVVHLLTERAAGQLLGLQEPRYALPMVGRKQELSYLEQQLARAQDSGSGRLIGITAEAGMGKSRLAAKVIGRALSMGWACYGGHGVSHGVTSPYLAWRPLLRGLLGLEGEQAPAEQIEHIQQQLTQIDPNLAARLPLLGEILGMDIPDNALTGSFEAQLRRQSLFALVLDLVRHQAEQSAMLLVLEDAHWLDDLSRDLTRYVAQQIDQLPVLLLTVYRPPEIEGQETLWETPPRHLDEIELGPFSPQESAELVRLKLADRDLPPALLEEIQERAQGNPFFVDEFVNLLSEQGINLDDPQALSRVEVPDSLRTLIIARLDQLAESERMTIRVASVIGRLFRAGWLLRIYPGEMQDILLQRNLEQLSSLDLVTADRTEPELEYLFKHALTQEVAYETLSFSNRRMLHERVADYIEQAYGQDLGRWYGILAYHYGRAEHRAKEFHYVRLAAERSARESAHRQAAAFYARAIDIQDASGIASAEVEFELCSAYFGQRAILAQAEGQDKIAERILHLAQTLDPTKQVKALLILGRAQQQLGHPDQAIPHFDAALALAREHDDASGLAEAMVERGNAYFGSGEYEPGKAMLQGAINLANQADWKYEFRASQVLGWIVYDEGDYAQTERYWTRAFELTQAHNYKPGEAFLLINLGVLYETVGYVQKGLDSIQKGLEIARQIGYRTAEQEGYRLLGGTLQNVGQHEQAWEYLERSMRLADLDVGQIYNRAYVRSCLAEELLETTGDLDQAEQLSHEALEIGRPKGGRELLGWLLHTRGRVLQRLGRAKEALEALEESAQMRRDIQQVDTLLDTLADLGRLHLQQGNLAAAQSGADEMLGLLFPVEGEGRQSASAGMACAHILKAQGEEQRARELVDHAYNALQAHAQRIGTEELARSFLEEIGLHREVLKAFQSW